MRYPERLPSCLAERVRYFETLPRFASNSEARAFATYLGPVEGTVGVVIPNDCNEAFVVVPDLLFGRRGGAVWGIA